MCSHCVAFNFAILTNASALSKTLTYQHRVCYKYREVRTCNLSRYFNSAELAFFFDMKLTLPVCLRKVLLTNLALGAAFVFSAPASAGSNKEVTENLTESTSARYSDVTVTVSPGISWTLDKDVVVEAEAVEAAAGAVRLLSVL